MNYATHRLNFIKTMLQNESVFLTDLADHHAISKQDLDDDPEIIARGLYASDGYITYYGFYRCGQIRFTEPIEYNPAKNTLDEERWKEKCRMLLDGIEM